MNPIEHVWVALRRRVAGHQPPLQTLQELERALLEDSSCASASCSNARELDEQILEVKINPQEKNTVSDTSTNKDTLYREKETKNENEETKWIRNDFARYVGTPIDADLREQILILGPYQPKGNFQKDAKGRSFSSSYNSFISKAGQKIERKWLSIQHDFMLLTVKYVGFSLIEEMYTQEH
ncbi:hypothetical protein TNCV_4268351 [Trichonephila clavipes]|nr:hypothetical protein TNCV_4268351 [Trichonephila clavipes]